MTGEELYNDFKDALNYLGVGFYGMSKTEIFIDKDKLRITFDNKECAIIIPEYNYNQLKAEEQDAKH